MASPLNHSEPQPSKNAARFDVSLAGGHPGLDLQALAGIGPRTAERLAERGIFDQRHLLTFLPRAYRSNLRNATGEALRAEHPERATFVGVVTSVRKPGRYRKSPLEVIVECDGVRVVLVWFNLRVAAFVRGFRVGRTVEVNGELDWSRSLPRSIHPSITWCDDFDSPAGPPTAEFEPVYPSIESVAPRLLRRAIVEAVERLRPHIVDCAPPTALDALDLGTVSDAFGVLHGIDAPTDPLEFETALARARDRLVYEECYVLQAHLAQVHVELRGSGRAPTLTDRELGRELVRRLPFQLTEDQRAVAATLAQDLGRRVPMRRLLQGDVGSGKTVVALMAAAIAVGSGAQVAVMAPTEVLAAQHFATAEAMFDGCDTTIALLTGSTPASARRELVHRLAEGEIDVLVGTHALMSDDVVFNALGLVVVDEQHKFGVDQRAELLGRGRDPHLLAMTATPIPRSLAHAVFGDLDLAVLRHRPPGREPVRTHLRPESARERVFKWVRDEVLTLGQQVYVVYPNIEPSTSRAARSLLDSAEELANGPLRGRRVGVLHGQMSSADKLAIMRRFEAGEVDVLCSTTVIEVGVDVPNATVMVVEGPEMFGLSQLHQLRGRIGRGSQTSRCILLRGRAASDDARHRLEVFARTTDGFELSELDLVIRGPGEFLGQRQAGRAEFRFVDLVRDADLLVRARRDARQAVLGDVASIG